MDEGPDSEGEQKVYREGHFTDPRARLCCGGGWPLEYSVEVLE